MSADTAGTVQAVCCDDLGGGWAWSAVLRRDDRRRLCFPRRLPSLPVGFWLTGLICVFRQMANRAVFRSFSGLALSGLGLHFRAWLRPARGRIGVISHSSSSLHFLLNILQPLSAKFPHHSFPFGKNFEQPSQNGEENTTKFLI